MKKILAIAAAVVALSGSAFAQATATGTVSVPLVLETVRSMNLGTISRDGTQVGNIIKNVVAGVNTAPTQSAGFRVKGDLLDDVKLTSASSVLTWSSGSASQTTGPVTQATTIVGSNFTFRLAGAVSNPASYTTNVTLNQAWPLARTQSGASGIGYEEVMVGGDWTITPDQQQGTYTGTVDITVAYM
jgi:hypothetical protein